LRKNIAENPTGFTLVELLIVLAVLAILMSIVALTFKNTRQRLDLEGVAHRVAQDLQDCRSLAISKSRFCRLRFDANGYDLQLSDDGITWAQRRRYDLPARISPSWSTGDSIVFDSRGFGSFPAPPDPYRITLSDGGHSLLIVPSMTGAVRVVKP
jgi:type II secretion system protein H